MEFSSKVKVWVSARFLSYKAVIETPHGIVG